MPRPILIGISGFGGSGKSTLAKALGGEINAPVIGIDSFAKHQNHEQGYEFWDIIDFKRLQTEIIEPFLANKNNIQYHNQDWKEDDRGEKRSLKHDGILIIEGIGLFRPELMQYFSCTIWIDCPIEEATRRGKNRNRETHGDLYAEYWDGIWKENDLQCFETYAPKDKANFLIKHHEAGKWKIQTAFIFHGTEGYPEENWFPWLKQELEKEGTKVIVPQFPTPKNQTPEKWLKVFEKYKEYYTPETVIFGHSLGGTFLLRLLEKYPTEIKGAFLIASPIGIPPIKNIKTDQSFLEDNFNFELIKKRARNFAVFHSDNDHLVGLANGEELAKKLGVKLQLVKGAGHFNAKAGYLKFPKILKLWHTINT